MHPRAAELIRTLRLAPHPEGGHFAEVFRSGAVVSASDSRGPRSALTVIYFLLVEGSYSRWHRVRSDEAWHWYEGWPLELLSVGPEGGDVSSTTLGPVSGSSAPLHIVPALWWQAARPLGPYALVGCSVGPGFDFADFTLLAAIPEPQRPHFIPADALAGLL